MPVPELCDQIVEAYGRIAAHIRKTPLAYSYALSEMSGAHVYLKCENMQLANSFKIRGALNKLLTIKNQSKSFVAASSGNHGLATALAARMFSLQGKVFVPTDVCPNKAKAILRLGITPEKAGAHCGETEAIAREYAKQHELPFISPYNDYDVIAGNGTVGYELLTQCRDADAVFIAVGGGGLLSGIGSYLKAHRPDIQIIAASPKNSAAMYHALESGQIHKCEHYPTYSDGTAGGLEADAITLPLCQSVIDDFRLVDEAEIAHATKSLISDEHMLVEGAAGVALAGFLQDPTKYIGKKCVIILCGANISIETLQSILNH